jgi:glycosyltransferase involved in cell wall biosynthesis
VFRLLYVGRLTRNKGVFDMIDMMSKLQKNRIGRFKLDICGTGPAEAELEVVIGEQGLEEAITMHGQCTTSQLQRLYGGCHAVLVPTRSDFEEGTPKVAFEAVLNFRPLIMSAACPALADVAQATVEPRVDDVDDYVLAIEKLGSNPELYHAMVLGATACRTKHFDERNSYGAKLRPALSMITAGRRRIAASAERHGLPSEPL